MTDLPVPDLADVLAARQRIAPYLRPTPLYRYPALDAMASAQLWVKHENHQPVLVSEDALRSAARLMIEKTRNLVEPAGAAALAAMLSAPGRFAGRTVTIVCSGGNISPAQLAVLGWAHER
jgi:threonine dehydratase